MRIVVALALISLFTALCGVLFCKVWTGRPRTPKQPAEAMESERKPWPDHVWEIKKRK